MRLPDRELPRVVSTRDAAVLFGYSREAVAHRVAIHRWRRIARGVLLTRDETPTREDWIQAGLVLAGPRAALSGWDAVRLFGIGARNPPAATVLLLDRGGANRSLPGVRVRPTSRPYTATPLPFDHETLAYVPVVHPARAVADTALLHRTFEPVRAMVTSAVQRRLCRPEELVEEFARVPRRDSHWLRRALEDVATGALSIAEAEAVELLARARVPLFEVNVPIVDGCGRLLAVADVLWRTLRMIVEVDSREFHLGEGDWKATMRRHTLLTRHGLAVEHHPPSAIRSGGVMWAAGIAGALRRRSADLGVPYVAGHGPLPVPIGGHAPLVLA